MAQTGIDRSNAQRIDAELEGLDQLEMAAPPRPNRALRIWNATWPKVLAVAIVLFGWQCVVWTGWKSEVVLPAPPTVFESLWDGRTTLLESSLNTLKRGLQGYALALVIGVGVGAFVARIKVLRAAIGSMITGLQTMPSIAWFPLAIVLFGFDESAIMFVVVLGAAPSIANGLISGIDHIPPILLRAGRVLGARRVSAFRHVILPAALPSFVGGLKQGWAFAWRSLLAGELLAIVPGAKSLGQQLAFTREFALYSSMMATMIVIFVIGVLIDALFFGTIERRIRRRYGLVDEATAA
jgi:NitT/TauT family transport system permease protein